MPNLIAGQDSDFSIESLISVIKKSDTSGEMAIIICAEDIEEKSFTITEDEHRMESSLIYEIIIELAEHFNESVYHHTKYLIKKIKEHLEEIYVQSIYVNDELVTQIATLFLDNNEKATAYSIITENDAD